jgi:hypothetical protein
MAAIAALLRSCISSAETSSTCGPIDEAHPYGVGHDAEAVAPELFSTATQLTSSSAPSSCTPEKTSPLKTMSANVSACAIPGSYTPCEAWTSTLNDTGGLP